MRYKNLSVVLDGSANALQKVIFSMVFASLHEAHLTGLYLSYTPYIFFGEFASVALEWEDKEKGKQLSLEDAFYAEAEKLGVDCDFLDYSNADESRLIAQARMTDLAIIGQANPEDDDIYASRGFPENFVLQLGKPVLVLPYTGNYQTVFDNIIVAWDGGREAARAIADALPLLKRAKQVNFLTVSEEGKSASNVPQQARSNLAFYLAQHGIKFKLEQNTNIHPANWLLSYAADYGANLVVMGAYGHSRLTEMLLGGTTYTMLRKMSLPILMSH